MNGALSPTRWLDVIRGDYLDTFVRDGGSTVKFAVHADGTSVTTTGVALLQTAADAGYLVASIDAKETRVHMPQNLFFRIAEQVDWHLLARMMVLRLCAEKGYDISGVYPSQTNILAEVATNAGLSAGFIATQLRPELERSTFYNRGMSRDFRVAMTHLCHIAMGNGPDDAVTHPIVAWLTGEQRGITAVHPFAISTAINRTTARRFMESLFHWTRQVGYSGTAIILDDSRITLLRNPKDDKVFYTRAMVMDHYELLRELIDSTDRLDGMLMAVLTGTDFEDTDQRSKGFAIYPALYTRIANEVRSRLRPNPLAAMARVGNPDDDGAES